MVCKNAELNYMINGAARGTPLFDTPFCCLHAGFYIGKAL